MNIDFVSPETLKAYLDKLIKQSLAEDTGSGDYTSLACIPTGGNAAARLLVKDNGIIAGIDLAEYIFNYFDPALIIEKLKKDGDRVSKGEVAFVVRGNAASILGTERLVLNFMQRLSGIATKTRSIVDKIAHTGTKLLDTRKTTPGLRILEKWAVRTGGGYNHRIGLFDMILIKDNHVDFSGGITEAVSRAKNYLRTHHLNLDIEVEIRNFTELDEAMKLEGIRRLLLDNFKPEDITRAVALIRGKFETEASGGINEDNIVEYARSGVDYISSGALTNSVRSFDLSLKIIR